MNRTGHILCFVLSVASVVVAIALHEALFAVPAAAFGMISSLELVLDIKNGKRLE